MKKLFAVLLFSVAAFAYAQQKHALVIGNNNYTGIRKLGNPVQDATDVAAKLRTIGYQVDLQTDVTNVVMARAISGFVQRLAQNRDNEGFFWFAGHGVQLNGENYLLPIDVNITNEVEAVHSSYSVKRPVDSLDQIARNKVNVVVLDACRDNPFVNMPGAFRNATRGLSVIQNLPSDLLVIYSTAAGAVALDGSQQRNSPFTQAFLQSMDSNEDIQIVFRTIARETMRLTNNNQRPFHDGSIINLDFYSLNPQRTQPVATVPVQPAPAPAPAVQPATGFGPDRDALANEIEVASINNINSTEIAAYHSRLPLSTMLRVTNLANNKQVDVRVMGRISGSTGQVLHITEEVARLLDITGSYPTPIKAEVVRGR